MLDQFLNRKYEKMLHFFPAFFNEHKIKGFLDEEEGLALYRYALIVRPLGACLEIGSYCGKSSVYLGKACQETGNTLFSVDHHRGSEEHQLGEEYHDADLYDPASEQINSLPLFQRTISLANLDCSVVPIVCSSQVLVKNWDMKLGLVFIDGGHSVEQAMHDCLQWGKHVRSRGYLAIHDIFEKPEDGGQAPWLAMTKLLESGAWTLEDKIKSLVVLKRVDN